MLDTPVEADCVRIAIAPSVSDEILAQKLMLENREQEFRIANRHAA